MTAAELDDAGERLRRYLAQRCNSRTTAYWHRRMWVRFLEYQGRHSQMLPLADVAQAWVDTMPVSNQGVARFVLKTAFGPTACDWTAIVVRRYRRNEARLIASVLRGEQRAKVRAVARGPQERALVEVLFTMRRFEAAALRWRDLDLANGMIHVRGKGAKTSWTLLTAEAQRALHAWREAAGGPTPETPVFRVPIGNGPRRRHGHPYTPGGLGRVVQKLLTRAGLWSRGAGCAHRFRRTFATEFLRTNPQDLIGLQRLMRHERIGTTEQYVWFLPEDLRGRVAAMEL